MEADEIIKLLNLRRHPEGGFFKETYRSDECIPQSVLPARYGAARSFYTCIYYMLTAETFSCIHKVASDEIFHFYAGDAIEMLQLFADGSTRSFKIGSNLTAGEVPQVLIPRGVWQGSRLSPGGKFALIGATVAPGFDYADYEEASRAQLLSAYPSERELITALTRKP